MLHTLLLPSPLHPGDIIGFFSPSATVERAFAHLKLCGVFDRVAAVILGKHELFDDKGSGRDSLTVLREVLNGQPLPVLADFDCCHTHPMLTMPLGVQASVDFDAGQVRLCEPWLHQP